MPNTWSMDIPHDAAVQACVEGMASALAVATGLAAMGRSLDLGGLDQSAGLLCARILDMPPGEAAAFRPTLLALDRTIANLTGTLMAHRPDPPA